MKKTICFYFQVHQPFRLRRYRFFDIGKNHQYFDDFNNRNIMKKIAERCYLPMNELLLSLINKYNKRFKVAFSISGSAIEQFELYAPNVLESFKKLAETGCVEFIAETSAHSLAIFKSDDEFKKQVSDHQALLEKHFGFKPKTFRLTELIYSDEIGAKVADMGFKTMLTEGARHVLGWKSPNFIYTNSINPKLKVLLRNFRLSDDISFRFSDRNWSEWPVTSDKYVAWLNNIGESDEIVNLFMDYETFGEHQSASTGIFEFMRYLPESIFQHSNFEFLTPNEAAKKHQPIAPVNVPFPISWADEERDLSAWLGNELQDDAFNSLYKLSEKMVSVTDPDLQSSWRRLQNSDHFYYMCTKWFSDGSVHKYFNPYSNPYEAYINYMNVLSDFELCLKSGGKKTENQTESESAIKTDSTIKASSKKVASKKTPAKKTPAKSVKTSIETAERSKATSKHSEEDITPKKGEKTITKKTAKPAKSK